MSEMNFLFQRYCTQPISDRFSAKLNSVWLLKHDECHHIDSYIKRIALSCEIINTLNICLFSVHVCVLLYFNECIVVHSYTFSAQHSSNWLSPLFSISATRLDRVAYEFNAFAACFPFIQSTTIIEEKKNSNINFKRRRFYT